MQAAKWDSEGVLREPDVHDASFTGICMHRPDAVSRPDATLTFKMEDGRPVELQLLGVERLVLEEFFEGNIVFEIEVKDVRNATDAELGLACREADMDARVLEWFAELRNSQLLLLEISPTYGAKCWALIRGVQYRFAEEVQ